MSKEVVTQINGNSISLTNLDKVLFEEAHIIKAQFIEYMLKMSDHIVRYTKNRPATLIRFPDGSLSKSFYSKNAPSWTPTWIEKIKIAEDDDNLYTLINDSASLVWAANLAALEIHTVQTDKANLNAPDHFIFDLDPPEGLDFEIVKAEALALHQFLSLMGYNPFIKTSGSKGVHLYVPIVRQYEVSVLMASLKKISEEYVKFRPLTTTLELSKDKRGNKILIDILRNHASNTCIIPYCTRGRPLAPISWPVDPQKFSSFRSSGEVTLTNYESHLAESLEYWEGFYKKPSKLHDQGSSSVVINTPKDQAQKLESYNAKRDFDKTSEPTPMTATPSSDEKRFCIQLHDATNLHYDLRLEHNGTLWSWAIPKGLPIDNNKRLAIRTEDHPLAYLTFEGVIPQGQYGGGIMWLIDQGNYTSRKFTESHIEISLKGKLIQADFQMVKTKDDQWLTNLLSHSKPFLATDFLHMLADQVDEVSQGSQYTYEIKWDGIRAFLIKNGQENKVISRGGRDITDQFEEIATAMKDIDALQCCIDCELVVTDEVGRPVFKDVISRLHSKSKLKVHKVVSYCFDMLSLDGYDLTSLPQHRRKAILQAIISEGHELRISQDFLDGIGLFDAIKAQEMEGIMIKDKNSLYLQGKRSTSWTKLKCRSTETALIIGYTKGEGDRSDMFGALHLATESEEGLVYIGKVGTGFDARLIKSIYALLITQPIIPKPITTKIEEESRTIWIGSNLYCEVKYASLTPNGTLREPSFIKILT
jgi:bifunctional non-homologous end joining protein LigD